MWCEGDHGKAIVNTGTGENSESSGESSDAHAVDNTIDVDTRRRENPSMMDGKVMQSVDMTGQNQFFQKFLNRLGVKAVYRTVDMIERCPR